MHTRQLLFLFATCKIELLCRCKIPITHLRTMPPSENHTSNSHVSKLQHIPDLSRARVSDCSWLLPWQQHWPCWEKPWTKAAQSVRRDFLFKSTLPKWLSGIGDFYFHTHQSVHDPLNLISFFLRGWIGLTCWEQCPLFNESWEKDFCSYM